MTLPQAIILFIAAMLGGTLNAVAGGGSFISFPALIFTGVPPIQANATSTVALWPGSVASVGAYRKELAALNRVVVLLLGVTSLVGGVLGAILLLLTPQATFLGLVPYLLLLATLLFAFSPRITALLRRRNSTSQGIESKASISRRTLTVIVLVQFVIAIYGGYFGGGIGIMILASLGVMGMENIHEMNGLKTVLQTSINGVAVITFVIARAVFWLQALVMIAGAIVGGYGGAYVARKLDPRFIRGFVIVVGVGMTIYFFLHNFKVI
ncbi:MAG TPA: sulfite exporter TauE/SafE family protein [Ktedonobacteraceae bacterium]|nr:sulfite exporter TauE/SafE family protein [Ktedonobacteraceae bacterium]